MFSQLEKCFPLKLINNCFAQGQRTADSEQRTEDRAIVVVHLECILMDCLSGISNWPVASTG